MKNHFRLLATTLSVIIAVCAGSILAFTPPSKALTRHDAKSSTPAIIIADVTYGSTGLPDTTLMTHLSYAFAQITEDFENLEIENPERFAQIAALCAENPRLGLILSVGGPRREGFSEMAGSARHRKAFAKNCRRLMDQYGIDWINFDWEFPGTDKGGHTCSPDDKENYVKLVRDVRKAIGKDRKISFYSNNGAGFMDFPAMMPYVDYVQASGYNLNYPPLHQSNLYPSEKCGNWCVDMSVKTHIEKGVPPEKIILGLPFYGRYAGPLTNGKSDEYYYRNFHRWFPDLTYHWDNEAKAPYLADKDGNLMVSFDDPRSLALKCRYVRDNGLAGVFYWAFNRDDSDYTLANTVRDHPA